MFKTKITSIGGSSGIIIPAVEVEFMGLKKEDWLEVTVKKVKKEVKPNETEPMETN